jgi:hypothetical protein
VWKVGGLIPAVLELKQTEWEAAVSSVFLWAGVLLFNCTAVAPEMKR